MLTTSSRTLSAFGQMKDIEAETRIQPFCGGVSVVDRDRMYLAVAKRKHWYADRIDRQIIPATWIGGGQECGESIRECAQREAQEELGCSVTLVPSRATYFYDRGEYRNCGQCDDPVPPLLVDIYPTTNTPYRPGLPSGPRVYVAVYQARLLSRPGGGDVPGLLRVRKRDIKRLLRGISVADARSSGILSAENGRLPGEAIVLLTDRGPERATLSLWCACLIAHEP